MQEPNSNDPRKGDDASGKKPAAPSSDFRLKWRDGDHDLSGDDKTPSVAYPTKPNPPRIVIEPTDQNALGSKPAESDPAKSPPIKYDFTPYRSGEGRMPTGYDPDDVDDVDYGMPFDASGNYTGDDDDEDPREDDPMFRIAERILPERPDILNTLDVISNVDFDSLVAAGIIEEEMRGNMPDKTVDRLTSAALLAGAENAYDVLDEVPKKIGDLMVDFNLASAVGNPEIPEFSQLSMDIQRLVIAFAAADFEGLSKSLRNGTAYAPDDDEMESAANFLVDASRNRSDKPTKGDIKLMQRAARAFNEVSQIMPLDFELRLTKDNGLAMYSKSDLDAPNASAGKKAENQKKNQPKPPKQ